MSNQIKTGQYIQDGGLINLPLGFIPDYIELANRDLTNTVFIKWWHLMQTNDISGSQEGISIDIAGVPTDLADAGGITAYDTGAQSPASGVGAGQIGEYADATTPTARTATAAGTYVIPSVGNAQDRGSIYECVASTGAVSTEPTWPSADGEQVTDDASNTWEKVNVNRQRGGYQGVVIAAAVQTNGQLMYYLALQSDQSVVHGDVDGWGSGIDPNA